MQERYDQIREKALEVTRENIDYWLEYCFLSPRWWCILTLFILTWVVFIRLTRKETNKPKLLFLGLVWIIFSANLDGLGFDLGLWGYPGQLIPVLPKAYLFDYALIPVTYMLLYKYFPKGKAFFYATIILSAGSSFISEMVFEWLQIYKIYHWKLWWSFVIYFLLSYVIRGIVEYVFRKEREQ
ncbi:hypothetical protein NQ095_12750 [Rossellomorea sp. SC111]|uniref:CBO0543 family protein n=1 Tax=Rossellomorea sp. SC111 TaxID=2968985 RepID=UPI00215B360E|nr:CBO0543 family protein [Rossellomorea sp. SC111]MCR8849284.1 hypothetical protein [Rossellomorea sp. SC111]